MTKTKSNAITTDSGWDVVFWFAVLSPVLGMVAGFLTALVLPLTNGGNEWTRYLQLRRRIEPHVLEI